MMKHARGLGSTKYVIGSNSWTRSDHTLFRNHAMAKHDPHAVGLTD